MTTQNQTETTNITNLTPESTPLKLAREICQFCKCDALYFVSRGPGWEAYTCKVCKRPTQLDMTKWDVVTGQLKIVPVEQKITTSTLDIEDSNLRDFEIAMRNLKKRALPAIADLLDEAEYEKAKKGLMPFQQEFVDRFKKELLSSDIAKNTKVVLNFDQMGLGKTVQAIKLAQEINAQRILIICPKNLLGNWRKEIAIFDNRQDAAVVLPNTAQRFDDFLAKFKGKWFITNVDTLRKDANTKRLDNFYFDLIIFDEAHHMRNLEGTAKAGGTFKFLRSRGLVPKFNPETKIFDYENKVETRLILMSGSPIVNSPEDIYPFLHLIDSWTFPTLGDFKREHCFVRPSGRDGKQMKTYAFRDPQFLEKIISKYGVQRLKQHVLKDLPPKIYNYIPLEMEEDQREFYDTVEQGLAVMLSNGEPLYSTGVLDQLIRLRQIALDPELIGHRASSVKVDFFSDFVDGMQDRPFVVFSTFETVLMDKLGAVLNKRGIKYGRITGKVSAEERTKNVSDFQAGRLQVILATIQAGGEGLTLTAASDVLMLDRWWTPASNEQAVDRLHRIGQVNSVNVHILQAIGTIDMFLDQKLREKRDMLESIRPKMADGTATSDETRIWTELNDTGLTQNSVLMDILKKHLDRGTVKMSLPRASGE